MRRPPWRPVRAIAPPALPPRTWLRRGPARPGARIDVALLLGGLQQLEHHRQARGPETGSLGDSSFFPSARIPTITRVHTRSWSRRTVTCTPSLPHVDVYTPDRSRSANRRCSSWQLMVGRVIIETEGPGFERQNSSSAGTTSPP